MKSQTLPFERTVLKNGVRLLLIPVPGVKSIATSVMVGVGSRYEEAGINGISHFLEHMVFKGTNKYPTTDDVNVIERQGGLQNAYTDIDVTNYHNKVLAVDWLLGLEINKELALHPLLEQKHVDKERDVIIEEMKRYEDEPAAKVGEIFHQLLYPDTKLGRRIIGTEKTLRTVASAELKSYHNHWYTPERIVVVLAGEIRNPKSEIRNLIEEWFGGLKNLKFQISITNKEGLEKITDYQDSPRLEVLTKPDAQQAHLTLGVRTFKRRSVDRFAWGVFNLLMGVSFTSRLFKEIREKKGLCYHIRSGADAWADVGYWSVYAGVATDKVEYATQAILDEFKKAVDSGVTEDEVVVAKKRLKTILAFKSEDPEFFSEYYGRQELYNDPIITLDEYLAKIEAVTVLQINSLICKYIKTDTLNLAVVWNKPREEKLLKMLKV